MDIWQFWIGIGIILALLGVIVAILVKKHRNKHRMTTLQKNIDDLEKSFRFLSEEIETTADLNIKTMEEKIESMRELLTIADKKCIFVQDLLDAIDNGAKTLKERNISFGAQIVNSPIDEEKILGILETKINALANDYKNEIDSFNRHLGYLNNRVTALEDKLSDDFKVSTGTDKELKDEISSIKKDISNLENSISETVTNEISKQLSVFEGFSEIAEDAIEADQINSMGENNMFTSENNVTELFPKFVDAPNNHKVDSDLKVPDNLNIEYYPKGKELVVKEIMEKYEQGISIPQIASELKMCRSEIQLIIKMNKRLLESQKVGNYGN